MSILFHLGKLAEEIIINKMRSKLEDVIEPAQFAYQPHIGTVDALIKLLDDFTSAIDNPNVRTQVHSKCCLGRYKRFP